MLSVTNKPFMLRVLLLNVFMLSVALLSVLAPFENPGGGGIHKFLRINLKVGTY
jgi:hypothetical protein